MNMSAPKWLGRNEPAAPALPPQQELTHGRPKAVLDFLETTDRMREELAYFKAHAAQLECDLKVANERNRSLEQELAHVRDDRDRLCTHDATLASGIHHLKLLCADLEQRARAEAYAPPATGHEPGPERPMDTADEVGLKVISATLAPERTDA